VLRPAAVERPASDGLGLPLAGGVRARSLLGDRVLAVVVVDGDS
jgi:hypothetical protein